MKRAATTFSSHSFHTQNYSLEGLPFYLGVAIYCFEGAGLILSLEGSVSKDLRSNFKTIFLVAMTIVTSLYIGFGVCGYLSFGPETEAIITLNLPGGKCVLSLFLYVFGNFSYFRCVSVHGERVPLFLSLLHLPQ